MTALLLPQSLPEWRRLAQRFVAWWLAELRGMVPGPVRIAWRSRNQDDVVLEFGRNHAKLCAPAYGATNSVSLIAKAVQPSDRSFIKQLARFQTKITIAPDCVLQTEIELPASAEGKMALVLRHQLERLVPLPPADVEFAWWIKERILARNVVKVAVSIVRATTLADARALCQELGLRPSAIVIPLENRSMATLWTATNNSAAAGQYRLRRLLEIATVFCAVGAYSVLCVRLDNQVDRLRLELSDLTAANAGTSLARKQIAAERERISAIRARLSQPTPLAILVSLTKITPLDTSISQFHLEGDTVDISGNSRHATSMLSLIENSAMFVAPAFTAPITSSAGDNTEHFEMSFRLRST